MNIDFKKLDTLSTDELSILKDDIAKERMDASNNLDLVHENKLDLERQISELKIVMLKGKKYVRELNTYYECAERAFWRGRNK